MTSKTPLSRFFEQLASDKHATDFTGPGTDLVELCIPKQSARWIVIDIAVTAKQLNCIERTLSCLFGSIENCSCRILARRLAPIASLCHCVNVGSRRIRRDIHVRNLALHQLECADRLSELLALVHIG